VEQQQQYVGIDLHRRRSVIVRRSETGQTLETVRIDNDPVALAVELAKAGEHPEVILEATGTGPPTCSKSAGLRSIWLIRWATTGAIGG
jgi:hypothetical protein